MCAIYPGTPPIGLRLFFDAIADIQNSMTWVRTPVFRGAAVAQRIDLSLSLLSRLDHQVQFALEIDPFWGWCFRRFDGITVKA
jgi:hypothetical protein